MPVTLRIMGMSPSKNVQAEQSRSFWMPVPRLEASPLDDSRPADLVVVGAGMAGLSIANEALLRGRQVTILDRGPIASGKTARTTAHLASALDDRFYEFVALRGEDEAKSLYESLAASIDRIEQIGRTEAIECDFARCDGYLFLGEGDDPDILEKEFDACRKFGFGDVQWAKRAPMPDVDTGRCLRFANQARFHPLKYLRGLVNAIERKGGRFHPFTPVDSIVQSEIGVSVKTRGGQTIVARDVADATNAPIAGRLTLQTKMAPYRSYAIALAVPKGGVIDALYWDTLDAYHYVRLQPGEDEDTLIVGGEDHKTGENDDAGRRFASLEAWARARFADLGDVTHRWSGQVLEPYDFAGFVGRDPDNDHIYFVTGDSGQGITNGAVAGLLIPALCEGEDHRWRKLYDPARVTLKAGATYISENATAAKNMTEHLGGPIRESADALKPGEGSLVRDGLSTIGAFRDEQGLLHKVSATCSHVNCVVHWNSLERCWDCPCHGSHFGIAGEVLNAPATSPLKRV
jgi:glycine/D-amino acid oxidase-like deaminating enzyme/nitrite reductase/ring-hydroxylating ferredoxin subunit